jgi:hypothetical protein
MKPKLPLIFSLVFASLFSSSISAAEPVVVNFGYAGAGVGGRPFIAHTSTAVAFNKGFLTDEFKNDPNVRQFYSRYRPFPHQ